MMQYRFIARRRALRLTLGSTLALAWGARPAWAVPSTLSETPGAAARSAPAGWLGQQPVKVIVPGAPGGLADNMMRFFLVERLNVALETTLAVETVPDANGVTGMAALAKAAPDGHTLAFADARLLTLMPHMDKAPYDPATDFVPVASVFALPVLVLATPALPSQDASDFPALLARARKNPGTVRWATGGAWSLGHLMLELVKAEAGADIAHVPYPRGGGLLLADARAGRFEVLAIPAEPAVFRAIKAGQLRPLAVGAPTRLKEELPHVPTLAELNFPGANLSSVYGFFAPANTSSDIVQKLNRVIDVQARDAEVRHHIDVEGLVAVTGPSGAFSRVIAEAENHIRDALKMAAGSKVRG